MKSDDEYRAIVNNFEEFAAKIADFERELTTGRDTAEAISKSTYPAGNTGFGFWIEGDLAFYREKYGDNVVGAVIEEIEKDFPELEDPHFFYWTNNEDVQDEIENFVNRYKNAFTFAAERIRQRIAEIEAQKENLSRAQEQARKAAETAAKYTEAEAEAVPEKTGIGKIFGKAFSTGLRGASNIAGKIASSIKGLFRRK